MKSLLIVIATLSLFNESINQYEQIDHMFTNVTSTFVPQAKTYFYTYIHNPAQMDSTLFSDFKNGSEKLVFNIPSALNVDSSKGSEFYIQVNTTKYYFETDLGYLTGNSFTIPNFMQFNYTSTTNIYISIPSFDSEPITYYGIALGSSLLMTKEAYKELLLGSDYWEGFNDGYDDGYFIGGEDGYDLGYDDGYDFGYDIGYDTGANTNAEMSGLFVMLGQGFASIASILSIQLFPGFTLGTLMFLPLIFGIAFVLLKFLLGGS